MHDGRSAMDRKVRQATATAELPPVRPDPPGALVGDLPTVDLIGRFVERATEVNADVRLVTADGALKQVVGIMEHYGADEYLGWPDSQMPADREGLFSETIGGSLGESASASDGLLRPAGRHYRGRRRTRRVRVDRPDAWHGPIPDGLVDSGGPHRLAAGIGDRRIAFTLGGFEP